jgi:hypothetical protein
MRFWYKPQYMYDDAGHMRRYRHGITAERERLPGIVEGGKIRGHGQQLAFSRFAELPINPAFLNITPTVSRQVRRRAERIAKAIRERADNAIKLAQRRQRKPKKEEANAL